MTIFDRLHIPTVVICTIIITLVGIGGLWVTLSFDDTTPVEPASAEVDLSDPFAVSRHIVARTESADGEPLDLPPSVLLSYAEMVGSGLLEVDDVLLLISQFCQGLDSKMVLLRFSFGERE